MRTPGTIQPAWRWSRFFSLVEVVSSHRDAETQIWSLRSQKLVFNPNIFYGGTVCGVPAPTAEFEIRTKHSHCTTKGAHLVALCFCGDVGFELAQADPTSFFFIIIIASFVLLVLPHCDVDTMLIVIKYFLNPFQNHTRLHTWGPFWII